MNGWKRGTKQKAMRKKKTVKLERRTAAVNDSSQFISNVIFDCIAAWFHN
jgi:hypothetical protein